MKSKKRKAAIVVPSGHSLAGVSSNEIEMEMVRRAMQRTDGEIVRLLTCVEQMRAKQIARQYELARQLAKLNGRVA